MLAITSLATRTAPNEPFSPITALPYALGPPSRIVATIRGLLDALDVREVPCVHPDCVARLDEQRHLDGRSSFEPCGLASTRHRVALETRVGRNHLQVNVDRQLDPDQPVL